MFWAGGGFEVLDLPENEGYKPVGGSSWDLSIKFLGWLVNSPVFPPRLFEQVGNQRYLAIIRDCSTQNLIPVSVLRRFFSIPHTGFDMARHFFVYIRIPQLKDAVWYNSLVSFGAFLIWWDLAWNQGRHSLVWAPDERGWVEWNLLSSRCWWHWTGMKTTGKLFVGT